MRKVIIDGDSLSLEQFINVSRKMAMVEISEDAIKRVKKSRALVDKFVEENKIVYGITTGFGNFSDVIITGEETKKTSKKFNY